MLQTVTDKQRWCKAALSICFSSVVIISGCNSSSSSDSTGTDDSAESTAGTTSVGDTSGNATGSVADNGGTDVGASVSGMTDSSSSAEVVDIYNAIFTERSADCADYVNAYDATVMDIKNSLSFDADVIVTATDSECTFTSNSVPNHDFNDESAAFAGGQEGATITATDTVSTVTRTPTTAASTTALTQRTKNAIYLNGVRLDILSAGCYRPNSADAGEDGNVNIGCSADDAWLLDPLGTASKFGADAHNAHTQPGGLYHYHGGPEAMFDDNPGSDGSPVIGFAADGFPIYGSYFYDKALGQVRKAVSGYTLKQGERGSRSDTNPGGAHDGTYNDDWEFTNAGDLDECNGMTIDGQYGYYVTDTYPWVIKCFVGTPHESFSGAGGAGPGAGPSR